MKIIVDSDEYRAWHEVGHAVVCLYFGGDVEFVEFLVGDARGFARTRCEEFPGTEKLVACGGFAAEFFLLKNGFAERGAGDDRDPSRIVFHNAIMDRAAFRGRPFSEDDEFSDAEDIEFRDYAIGPDGTGGVIPIFVEHAFRMRELVRELLAARRVEGRRIRELLRLPRRG